MMPLTFCRGDNTYGQLAPPSASWTAYLQVVIVIQDMSHNEMRDGDPGGCCRVGCPM
jgi:hypothetical protein